MSRKRGAPAHVPVSLQSRIALKHSFDSGELSIYNGTKKCRHSAQELVNGSCDPFSLINASTQLGDGSYGQVMLLCDERGRELAALKVAGCDEDTLGSQHSPFRSENIEPRMLQFLWERFVHVTPHLVAPMGPYGIVRGATPEQLRKEPTLRTSLVYFMERATRTSMREHLRLVQRVEFDLHFRVLVFQVCYTLEAIFMRYPNFRHNDLKDDNVLLHAAPTTGHTLYRIHGRDFAVPNIGVQALISDFSFACIPGQMLDNTKALEFEWELASVNIDANENRSADMYSLVSFVRINKLVSEKLSYGVRATLDRLFGRAPRGENNSFYKCHVSPEMREEVPTAYELLMVSDELFADFVVSDSHLEPEYNADQMEELAPPFGLEANVGKPLSRPHAASRRGAGGERGAGAGELGAGDTRHCIIIHKRNSLADAQLQQTLPSLAYYRALPLAKLEYISWESESALTYNEQVNLAAELLRLVGSKHVYGHHDFGAENKAEFMQQLAERAQDFIDAHLVPSRWWCAVFSCAFVDTAYDMQLVQIGQHCWTMQEWCAFWSECGRVHYTGEQLLHFVLQWKWIN